MEKTIKNGKGIITFTGVTGGVLLSSSRRLAGTRDGIPERDTYMCIIPDVPRERHLAHDMVESTSADCASLAQDLSFNRESTLSPWQ